MIPPIFRREFLVQVAGSATFKRRRLGPVSTAGLVRARSKVRQIKGTKSIEGVPDILDRIGRT